MTTATPQPKVHIGNVIRNAVVFNLKNWREGTANAGTLPHTVARLFALLHERQVEYVLAGDVVQPQYIRRY